MGVPPSIRQIGKYEVIDVVGTGGMGIVFRAHDPVIGRTVAIKMLKQTDGTSTGSVFGRFFSREMKSTGNLNHKNIVTVYDSGEHEGNPYLVMEYLEGEPISKLIAERRAMSLVEKLGLVIQVCDGLQYAHDRNIVHRDVKPANVIVMPDGTAKIVDFGVARIAGSESSILATGQLVGSFSYMSPEQINGLPIDSRTDLFSTGVLLFELLTYQLPFKGVDTTSTFVKILREEAPPLSQFVPNIPPAMQAIMNRALAKNPNDRYQAAEELSFDLIAVQEHLKTAIIADSMKRVEAAVERGNLDRAKDQLLEVLRLDRQNERANRLLRDVRKRMQEQQRASQIVQMRSQAQVALAGAQYEEALACADQALRLDASDAESLRLFEEIREAASRAKAIREALNRAEAALLAGDLDDGKKAVEEALRLDPSQPEARALRSVIDTELDERSGRQKVQEFVLQARRGIADRNYTDALDALHRAAEINPDDSNVRELLQWAERGQEQEKRRKSLLEITDQIEKALQAGDFSSACTISEMGIQRFPEDSTLVRLRAISQKQRDVAEKRQFVQEKSLAVKVLNEQGKLSEAIAVLSEALVRYPAEPNLESLLAITTAELDQQERELQEAARQQALERENAERKAQLSEKVLLQCAGTRRLLEDRADLAQIAEYVAELRSVLESGDLDAHARDEATAVLEEVDTRLRARDEALAELEQLRERIRTAEVGVSLNQPEDRVRGIRAAYPSEPGVQGMCSEVAAAIARRREEQQRALSGLTALLSEVDRMPAEELHSVESRAQQLSIAAAADPAIPALLQQIADSVRARVGARATHLTTMAAALEGVRNSRSLEELTGWVERAESVAALDRTDGALDGQLRDAHAAADQLRSRMKSLLEEMKDVSREVEAAETAHGAEALTRRVRHIAEQGSEFQELKDEAARTLAAIERRRRDHEAMIEELQTLRTSLPSLQRDHEVHSVWMRADECRRQHANDGAVVSLCRDIEQQAARLLNERKALRERKAECDNALRAAEQLQFEGQWDSALQRLLAVERDNPQRTDLRAQIQAIRGKLEQLRLQREREEQERFERERKARQEAEAQARQRAAEQVLAQATRLLADGHEKEAIETLRTGLEVDPGNQDLKLGIATASIEIARREAERQAAERQRLEDERIAKKQAEREQLEKQRLERERSAAQKAERERAEKERLERERIAAQKAERERAERQRQIAKEQIARQQPRAQELEPIAEGERGKAFSSALSGVGPDMRVNSQRPLRTRALMFGSPILVAVGIGSAVLLVSRQPAVTIRTDPADATLHVDGKPCENPCVLRLARGTHDLSATRNGYQDLTRPFSVTGSGGQLPVIAMTRTSDQRTEPISGAPTGAKGGPQISKVSVKTGLSDASVYVDGALRGKTTAGGQLDTELPYGSHQVRVVKQGFKTAAAKVEVGTEATVIPLTLEVIGGASSGTNTETAPNSGAPNAASNQPNKLEARVLKGADAGTKPTAGNVDGLGKAASMPQIPIAAAPTVVAGKAPDKTDGVPGLEAGTTAPGVDSDREGVKASIQRYEHAIEIKNLPEVLQIWPGIDKKGQDDMKKSFEDRKVVTTLRFDCKNDDIKIERDQASAKCRVSSTNARVETNKQQTTFSLRKQGPSWIIESIH